MNFSLAVLFSVPMWGGAANDNQARCTEHLIPLEKTEQLFASATQQILRFAPVIFSRLINVPRNLWPGFSYRQVVVAMKLGNSAWMKPSQNKTSLEAHPSVGAYLGIELHEAQAIPPEHAIGERYFAELFLPRRALFDQIINAAEIMGPHTAISTGRLSLWQNNWDTPTGDLKVDIRIDLSGMSHAEVATLINTLAQYLDMRSKK